MAYYKNIRQIKYCACVDISRVCLSVKLFDFSVLRTTQLYISIVCMENQLAIIVSYQFFNPMYSQVDDKGDLVPTYLLNVPTNLYKHTDSGIEPYFLPIQSTNESTISNVFNFSNLVFLSIEFLPLHEGMFLESWVQIRKIFADLNLGENVSIRSFPISICLTSISVCFNNEIHNSVLKKQIFTKLSTQVYHKICGLNISKQYNNFHFKMTTLELLFQSIFCKLSEYCTLYSHLYTFYQLLEMPTT